MERRACSRRFVPYAIGERMEQHAQFCVNLPKKPPFSCQIGVWFMMFCAKPPPGCQKKALPRY